MTAPKAGEWLGRYELLFPVAKGGMAEVWAARLRGTRGFQKTVAIKMILQNGTDEVRMEQMFLQEATLASQIHHPNVVGTIELGEQDGVLFLVMEWVEGETLNFIMTRAIDHGGVPVAIAVNVIGQACKGLHAAHELTDANGILLGLVHRDISAQNVLVTYSGSAKVVDFGVAKAAARASGLTKVGELKGKFAYMAPEQINAQEVDRRADIFSMGVLLYLMTTGRHPFRGVNPAETLRNICLSAPVAPSTLVANYSAEIEKVVLKALEKAPSDRWATANEMLTALEGAMPECLEGSFEVQVAAYLKALLGERPSEQRIKLRRAEEEADAARSEPQPHASVGSLRGIAVDQQNAAASNIAPPYPVREVTVDYAATHPSARAPRRRRNFVRAGWVLTASLAGLLVVGVLATRWTTAREGSRGAASGVAPAVSFSAILPTTEVSAAAPAPSAAPATNGRDTSEDSKRSRKQVASPRVPVTVAPANAPLAAAAPFVSPSAQQAPSQAREGSTSNAWDPATFGGRR